MHLYTGYQHIIDIHIVIYLTYNNIFKGWLAHLWFIKCLVIIHTIQISDKNNLLSFGTFRLNVGTTHLYIG